MFNIVRVNIGMLVDHFFVFVSQIICYLQFFQVTECYHCECLLGTIVCHQHKCPSLTCLHTVTLSGHCCPICRDQLSLDKNQDKRMLSNFSILFSKIIISYFSSNFFIPFWSFDNSYIFNSHTYCHYCYYYYYFPFIIWRTSISLII